MKGMSRRRLLAGVFQAVVAMPWLYQVSESAPVMPLDPADPQAKRLGYVENAATVDRGANPSFSADQKCSNCVQYRGRPGEPRGPCNVFEGKTVAAAGWCVVWGQETGD